MYCESLNNGQDENCGTELLLRQKLPADMTFSMFWYQKHQPTEGNGRKPLCAYHEYAQDDETI